MRRKDGRQAEKEERGPSRRKEDNMELLRPGMGGIWLFGRGK
jgi:hypothetical protein